MDEADEDDDEEADDGMAAAFFRELRLVTSDNIGSDSSLLGDDEDDVITVSTKLIIHSSFNLSLFSYIFYSTDDFRLLLILLLLCFRPFSHEISSSL